VWPLRAVELKLKYAVTVQDVDISRSRVDDLEVALQLLSQRYMRTA
jgi:hypothetical protein